MIADVQVKVKGGRLAPLDWMLSEKERGHYLGGEGLTIYSISFGAVWFTNRRSGMCDCIGAGKHAFYIAAPSINNSEELPTILK